MKLLSKLGFIATEVSVLRIQERRAHNVRKLNVVASRCSHHVERFLMAPRTSILGVWNKRGIDIPFGLHLSVKIVRGFT